MPNPEDAFEDEDAPPIPGPLNDDPDAERERQEASRSIDDAVSSAIEAGEAEANSGEQAFRSSAALSRGISASGGGGGSGDGVSSQLLDEVRAIRSAIESLLNS